jgi:hypothetical protein
MGKGERGRGSGEGDARGVAGLCPYPPRRAWQRAVDQGERGARRARVQRTTMARDEQEEGDKWEERAGPALWT